MNPIEERLKKEREIPTQENIIAKLFSGLFGEKKFVLGNKQPAQIETVRPGLIGQIKALPEFISQRLQKESLPIQLPTSAKIAKATPMPTLAPTPRPKAQMKEAINVYGGDDAPLQKYASQLEEATQKYDLFKNNPYLLPVIAHLETSSGKNVTRPNNLLNWGINYPGNNAIFAKMTPEEVLDRAISGMGERSDIYKQFRTGRPLTDEEILEFAKIYEPANPSYGKNLLNGIRSIEKQINGI